MTDETETRNALIGLGIETLNKLIKANNDSIYTAVNFNSDPDRTSAFYIAVFKRNSKQMALFSASCLNDIKDTIKLLQPVVTAIQNDDYDAVKIAVDASNA